MRDFFSYITMLILLSSFMLAGLNACEYEAQQNEIKNRQWIQDIKDGKPYTNYGE